MNTEVFWEQVKDTKWSLFVTPKATLLNLVQHDDTYLATCLHGVKRWPITTPIAEVQAEAQQWLKNEILPKILTLL